MTTGLRKWVLLAGLGAGLGAGWNGSAQAPIAANGDAKDVRLDVSVTGKDGVPVDELTEKDFTVLDNKAGAPITSFKAVPAGQSKVGVILLIDALNIPYSTVS